MNEEKSAGVDFKKITLAEMEKERPDMVSEIAESARSNGAADAQKIERERCAALVALVGEYSMVKDAAKIVGDAVANGEKAEAATMRILRARCAQLEAATAAREVGANGVPPVAEAQEDKSPEGQQKAHIARAREYQKAHGGTMEKAMSATVEKK